MLISRICNTPKEKIELRRKSITYDFFFKLKKFIVIYSDLVRLIGLEDTKKRFFCLSI